MLCCGIREAGKGGAGAEPEAPTAAAARGCACWAASWCTVTYSSPCARARCMDGALRPCEQGELQVLHRLRNCETRRRFWWVDWPLRDSQSRERQVLYWLRHSCSDFNARIRLDWPLRNTQFRELQVLHWMRFCKVNRSPSSRRNHRQSSGGLAMAP